MIDFIITLLLCYVPNSSCNDPLEDELKNELDTFKESLVSTQEGLSRLKEDGILKEHPTGGYVIESTPENLNFSFPLSLKDKAINLWSKEDSVWLNTTYSPWFDDEQCKNFRISFSTRTVLPNIGLISFPRSGNSWTRRLIEGVTGIFSGSTYYGLQFPAKHGMFGEAVPYHSGLTCLIKGHGNFNPDSAHRINKRDKITSRQNFLKELEIVNGTAVLLIRNPYHVIYSYKNYVDKGMAGHSDESKFFGPEWDNFVWFAIRSWEQFYLDWLVEGKNIMLIYYEKLLSDELESTLIDTVSFMNMNIDNDRLECTVKHSEGSFPRKEKCIKKGETTPNCNENDDIYSRKHVLWINSAIRKVRSKVKKLGLDTSYMKKYENTSVRLKYCS